MDTTDSNYWDTCLRLFTESVMDLCCVDRLLTWGIMSGPHCRRIYICLVLNISHRKQTEIYSSACIWFICCTQCLKLSLAYFTMTWFNWSLLSTHSINPVPCKINLIYSNTSFAKQVNVHMCGPGHNVFRKSKKFSPWIGFLFV